VVFDTVINYGFADPVQTRPGTALRTERATVETPSSSADVNCQNFRQSDHGSGSSPGRQSVEVCHGDHWRPERAI
jgi:hypothetical protein